MAINTTEEYIDFFINLNMGEKVSLLSFVNNERMVLKQKLENKINKKEPIKKAINILEGLINEIAENGEPNVLKKYKNKGWNQMDKNSEIIKIEIIRILNENGKIRDQN